MQYYFGNDNISSLNGITQPKYTNSSSHSIKFSKPNN